MPSLIYAPVLNMHFSHQRSNEADSYLSLGLRAPGVRDEPLHVAHRSAPVHHEA